MFFLFLLLSFQVAVDEVGNVEVGVIGREGRSRLLTGFAFESVAVLGCDGIEAVAGRRTCEFEPACEYSCCDEVFGT